jgi:hypothetical protein
MNTRGQVLAILPSREEAKTIARVVSEVDRAVSGYDSLIFNVDCSANGDTRQEFLSTRTSSPKRSLSSERVGKGHQVLLAIAESIRPELCLMLDTDNHRPEAKIYEALLSTVYGGADLAIADYSRLWIEGNLTNHIARPVLYASIGLDLPQPISGDIAMSGRLAWNVLEQFRLIDIDVISHCVQGYGIDAFIVLVAAKAGFRIAQVPVTRRKFHATSFPHLPTIFRDATPILLAPSFRRGGVRSGDWSGRFRLAGTQSDLSVPSMIERLEGLWPGDAPHLPTLLAEVWPSTRSDLLVHEGAAALWPAYVCAVKSYLRVGMSGGVRAARAYLSSSMNAFIMKVQNAHEY